MKVLMINGSPNGNTAMALKEIEKVFLEGAGAIPALQVWYCGVCRKNCVEYRCAMSIPMLQ